MTDKKKIINDFFGGIPIYIINLSDCSDRRHNMEREFEGYDNLHFVEGIDGRYPDFNSKYNITCNNVNQYSNVMIAITCSHLKAIYQAYHNGDEFACIFEDDVGLDTLAYINYTLKDLTKLNDDWELIQLFYIQHLEQNWNDYVVNGIRLLKRNINYSGTCYLINRKAMEKVLTVHVTTDGNKTFVLNPALGNMEPETFAMGYLNSYVVNFPCIYYYSHKSTYGVTEHHHNWHYNSKEFIRRAYINQLNILNQINLFKQTNLT